MLGNDAADSGVRDSLDRTKLAEVIAEFLRDPRTRKPLTLSIEGRWGSGKTRFMRIVRELIDPPKGASEPKRRLRTIWFNPWLFQSHEELWAAFALSVVEQVRGKLSWSQRVRADWKLAAACLDQRRFWKSALWVFLNVSAFVALVVFFAAFHEAGWTPEKLLVKMSTPDFWKYLVGVPDAISVPVVAVAQSAWWLWKALGGRLQHDLEVHLERPDYAARTSFLASFHEDFARAMKLYCGDEPWVVFIDDLDRCDVPRAAELMQAINLMLGEDAPLIYVLGMDRAKVAAGIAVKHRELLPFLYAHELAAKNSAADTAELRGRGLEYGYEFIEKFIQLPFRLPPSGREELRRFIRSRLVSPEAKSQAGDRSAPHAPMPAAPVSGEARSVPGAVAPASEPATSSPEPEAVSVLAPVGNPSPPPAPITAPPSAKVLREDETHLEAPLLHAVEVLDGNPRRVAQLINLVRLQRRLAVVLELKLKDGQLAKWTAVALRWPVFLVELEQERGLMRQLVSDKEPDPRSPRYMRWNAEPTLVRFLRDRGPTGADPADYDLTLPGVVEGLLRLGVAVPVAETAAAAVTPTEVGPPKA